MSLEEILRAQFILRRLLMRTEGMRHVVVGGDAHAPARGASGFDLPVSCNYYCHMMYMSVYIYAKKYEIRVGSLFFTLVVRWCP